MQLPEIITERKVTLHDPLPGPEGPIDELTLHSIERCDIGTRLRNMRKPLWRVSRMTGVAPQVLAHLSERDQLSLTKAMLEMAASYDAAAAVIGAAANGR